MCIPIVGLNIFKIRWTDSLWGPLDGPDFPTTSSVRSWQRARETSSYNSLFSFGPVGVCLGYCYASIMMSPITEPFVPL